MSGAYTDFEGGLNRHSQFKLHNKELSEDLVQDTFMKTWGGIWCAAVKFR